jgi:hypothetical protein
MGPERVDSLRACEELRLNSETQETGIYVAAETNTVHVEDMAGVVVTKDFATSAITVRGELVLRRHGATREVIAAGAWKRFWLGPKNTQAETASPSEPN